MSLISKLFFALILLIGNEQAVSQNYWQIQEIQGESDENSTLVTVRLDREMTGQKIVLEEHGTFIQILIPQSQVLQPGQFFDGNSPYVRKIAAFQVSESTSGLRLFVSEEAAKIKPAVSSELMGERILIHIDHAKIAQEIKDEKAPFAGVPPVEEVIRRTEVRQDIPDPASRTHDDVSVFPANEQQAEFGRIQEKLEWLTAASAAIFLLFTLFLKYRRRLWKGRGNAEEGPAFTMKTLATFPLAPKQRLTLVEIAGQKILLGVSPDNINYLTEIHGTNYHMRSQQILEHIAQRKNTPIAEKTNNSTQNNLISDKQASVRNNQSGPVKKAYPAAASLEGEAVRAEISQKAKVSSGINSVKSSLSQAEAKQRSPQSNELRTRRTAIKKSSEPTSIEDVTNLIRRKLKDLPKI